MKIAGLTFPMPEFSCHRPMQNRRRMKTESAIARAAARIDSQRVLLAMLPRASAAAEIAGMIRRELAR
jgi:hypothetical protein